MAQRDTPCGAQLHVCAVRVTRLSDLGVAVGGGDGGYVSDKITQVQRSTVNKAGADLTLEGGCDCPIATYRGEDQFQRYTFEVAKGGFEPAVEEMLLGGELILDDSDIPVAVGRAFAGPPACGDPRVASAIEFWCKHITAGEDSQNEDLPWIHHVYPNTRWSSGQSTFGNDFASESLTGFTKSNPSWGDGPYGDGPESVYGAAVDIRFGAAFYTPEDPPAATCDFVSVTPGS